MIPQAFARGNTNPKPLTNQGCHRIVIRPAACEIERSRSGGLPRRPVNSSVGGGPACAASSENSSMLRIFELYGDDRPSLGTGTCNERDPAPVLPSVGGTKQCSAVAPSPHVTSNHRHDAESRRLVGEHAHPVIRSSSAFEMTIGADTPLTVC